MTNRRTAQGTGARWRNAATARRRASSASASGLRRLDSRLDPLHERRGVLARGAGCERQDHLAEAVALEVVEDREPSRAVPVGLQVVTAVRDGDRVLRSLGPPDLA